MTLDPKALVKAHEKLNVTCHPELGATYDLRAAITAYLEALASAGAGDGWRPIETAPKDGTRVELWHKSPMVKVGGWPVHGSWRDYFPGQWSWRSDSGLYLEPTAWRPSAAAPLNEEVKP